MLHLKVDRRHAESARQMLSRHGMLESSSLVQHRSSYVYIPVCNIDTRTIKKVLEANHATLEELRARSSGRVDYPKLLSSRIGDAAASYDTGYDALGNIALIDGKLPRKEALSLASCIMLANRNIATVLSKGPVKGTYRTRSLKHVSGKRTFIALYRENSCTFRFDVRKTFFSCRLSYERARIARLARHDKNVMVMFAGIGPFAIEIAKGNPKARVVAVELNPYAYRSMQENAGLNRTPNVEPVLADVRSISRRYRNFADRIVMPLPASSTEFLDDALSIARDGCTIHLYSFVEMDGGTERLVKRVREHAKRNSCSIRVLFRRTARNYSAKEIEAVVDYRVRKRRFATQDY